MESLDHKFFRKELALILDDCRSGLRSYDRYREIQALNRILERSTVILNRLWQHKQHGGGRNATSG